MERVCLLYLAFVVLIYVVSLTGAEETEPMCFSRWDYEHKMLRQLSKMEDKLEAIEGMNKQHTAVIKKQAEDIKLLKDKGIISSLSSALTLLLSSSLHFSPSISPLSL